jgi:hypothetical protein
MRSRMSANDPKRSLESPMFGFSGTCPDFHPNAIWTVKVSGKIMASVPPGDVRPLSASQLQTRICTSRAPPGTI